jgi:hypothetical protein
VTGTRSSSNWRRSTTRWQGLPTTQSGPSGELSDYSEEIEGTGLFTDVVVSHFDGDSATTPTATCACLTPSLVTSPCSPGNVITCTGRFVVASPSARTGGCVVTGVPCCGLLGERAHGKRPGPAADRHSCRPQESAQASAVTRQRWMVEEPGLRGQRQSGGAGC